MIHSTEPATACVIAVRLVQTLALAQSSVEEGEVHRLTIPFGEIR